LRRSRLLWSWRERRTKLGCLLLSGSLRIGNILALCPDHSESVGVLTCSVRSPRRRACSRLPEQGKKPCHHGASTTPGTTLDRSGEFPVRTTHRKNRRVTTAEPERTPVPARLVTCHASRLVCPITKSNCLAVFYFSSYFFFFFLSGFVDAFLPFLYSSDGRTGLRYRATDALLTVRDSDETNR